MDYEGSIVYSEEPIVSRKIATENTMSDLRKMLRGVITNGTGTNADIKGWKIAGKTGTAQKWQNGKYSDNKFISNFTGFFPHEQPQLLAFIMLDEPRKPFHWGNEGAAIAFRRIMKRIINMDDSINPPETNKTHEIQNNNITSVLGAVKIFQGENISESNSLFIPIFLIVFILGIFASLGKLEPNRIIEEEQ